jgi:crotonobetainyl-CoA:carnitine CoA-transferase CaiB-like acyl-CoA transferase
MSGALDGIRVLDFTIAQQGPYATVLLADMGAEVIKVEQPGRGEVGRLIGRDIKTGFPAYFLSINRGKRSLTLDLTTEKGREAALRIGREVDVVAHNFRPGVMEKLGLGYEAFAAENPGVIYAGASAFGSKGPLGQKPGNDLLAQAYGGLMSVTGDGDAPVPAGAAVADHIGALTLALGIVSALMHRERTGKGQQVECSLLGSIMAAQSWELTMHMVSGTLEGRAGRGNNLLPFQWYSYTTADGWLAVGGVSPDRWEGFCEAIEWPDLITDERWASVGNRIRERAEINALIDRQMSKRETAYWMPRLEAADIFCAPVLDYAELTASEQARANGYIREIDHPRGGPTRIIPTPISFSETPADSSRPEPELGEHTAEVLRAYGYGDDEIEAMRQDGVA